MAEHVLKWEGDPHPEFEKLVREEIDGLLDRGLGCAADLMFHTIELDHDQPTGEGPVIMLSGKCGDLTFYAEYVAEPEIVTIKNWSQQIEDQGRG
jgi:hypothetical protein